MPSFDMPAAYDHRRFHVRHECLKNSEKQNTVGQERKSLKNKSENKSGQRRSHENTDRNTTLQREYEDRASSLHAIHPDSRSVAL